MTVVLSYHQIVEREPSQINSRWKLCTAILLLVIVSSCVVVSFSLHGLMADYNHNCLLGARLKFIVKTNESRTNETVSATVPTSVEYGIDEYWSSWSNGAYCETLKYMPLLQGICCTVWLAMFLTHGPGGIMPKPWRIVFPSLIFFFGCLVTSVVTASFITQGLSEMCIEFGKVDTGMGCARLVDYFALSKQTPNLVNPDKNFFLTLIFPWIWVGATCLGFLVSLLRIVLMVDFQLMRVDILKHEKQQLKGPTQDAASQCVDTDDSED
ncbi:uncharacterized protein LOC131210776 [Anopheles bellator]|uniref:uncharacterized protein LOC131210776 n=1 Tax=Anopheles bellator TaxID=139047 RepID=UPI0026475D35|nr:uncharacterized protein LOC131210776 [Anopheles bellator]